jgi:hypothetical protein
VQEEEELLKETSNTLAQEKVVSCATNPCTSCVMCVHARVLLQRPCPRFFHSKNASRRVLFRKRHNEFDNYDFFSIHVLMNGSKQNATARCGRKDNLAKRTNDSCGFVIQSGWMSGVNKKRRHVNQTKHGLQ